jgi:hypothetical protein
MADFWVIIHNKNLGNSISSHYKKVFSYGQFKAVNYRTALN